MAMPHYTITLTGLDAIYWAVGLFGFGFGVGAGSFNRKVVHITYTGKTHMPSTKEKREAMAAIRALQEILRELEARRQRLQIAFAELFEIAQRTG